MNVCSRCGLAHAASGPCPVTAALPVLASNAPLPPGTVVAGRFRVEQVAHRSGMSTVYQATDTRNPGAVVALKEFNAAGLPPDERAEALTWLAREAGLLSVLGDSRLPKLLAAADEGDRHYVVMPFLQGETLEERVAREGAQPETLVLSWGRELAGLLRYLHAQDPPVVHRDLKPANVLLRPDGSLILLDLGVARPLVRGTVGTAVGTPGYAPPEQYQGLADERSDLYGLGATLHRALTGYNPDQAAPFRHPPVSDLAPDVSAETTALISGLLEIAPDRRPVGAEPALVRLSAAMRGAFAKAYRPVQLMYAQMLVLLIIALGLGAAIYLGYFGMPLTGGDGAAFKEATPADTLRVLAVFAPGLLAFLPLLHPHLRALARTHRAPRVHRNRATRLLGLAWGIPLVIWQVNLFDQRPGNLVAVPGHSPAAIGLALGAALMAALGLLALRRELRRLQVRIVQLRWRFLAGGALLALWPISLAMQAPTFHGNCYAASVQSEGQSQFSSVQALATDRAGDLYVLDQYGLRERTPSGQFHYLLDFAESTSPRFSTTSFTKLAISPDGRIFLGTDNDGSVYELRAGKPRLVSSIDVPYYSMAAGRGGLIYLTPRDTPPTSKSGQIRAVVAGQWTAATNLAIAASAIPRVTAHVGNSFRGISLLAGDGWQPEGLAVDDQGDVFFTDGNKRSIEELTPSGQVRTVVGIGTGDAGAELPLIRDAGGTLYTASGTQVIRVAADRTSEMLPAGDGFNVITAATSVGPTIYAAVGDSGQALFQGMDGGPVVNPVGGGDLPAQHCDLPRR